MFLVWSGSNRSGSSGRWRLFTPLDAPPRNSDERQTEKRTGSECNSRLEEPGHAFQTVAYPHLQASYRPGVGGQAPLTRSEELPKFLIDRP